MATPAPLVSVCMRTHNDGEYLHNAVAMVLGQASIPLELLIMDDHSTDGTPAFLASLTDPRVRLLDPPEGRYIPAKTLNLLVAQSRGQIIVFNNGDALPTDEEWLENLITPLLEEEARVVFARQVARRDADLLVYRDMSLAFGPNRVSTTWKLFFSLVSSAFWRQDLIHYPFDSQYQYSEDVAWVRVATQRGVKVAMVPTSIVEHSHNYTIPELRKRFYNEGIAEGQMTGESMTLAHAFISALKMTLADYRDAIRRAALRYIVFSSPRRRFTQRLNFARGTHAGVKLYRQAHEAEKRQVFS